MKNLAVLAAVSALLAWSPPVRADHHAVFVHGVQKLSSTACAVELWITEDNQDAFEAVDHDAFPMITLARAAGERGGTAPCAFNAANEVAVAAFLDGRLRFDEISDVVAETLAAVDGAPARDVEDLVDADDEARRLAARRLQPA